MVRVGTLGPSLRFQRTGARTEPLLDVTLHSMPIDASTVAVLRWTLHPSPQSLVVPAQGGPVLLVVESGHLTAT